MTTPPFTAVRCHRFRTGSIAEITDTVAQEIELTIRLDNGPLHRLFASPRELDVLALGHAALEYTPPERVPEILHETPHHFEMASAEDCRPALDPTLPRILSPSELLLLMRRFIAAPGLWDETGCFHRAALFDTVSGEFVARAEDIGRHNCADRLAGHCLRIGIRPGNLILFLSCRVTASMMEKAVRLGVRLIVSRSAVTDAAIASAGRHGAILIGFAREAEERLTVFTDPGKLLPPSH